MSFFKWSRNGERTKVIRYGEPTYNGGIYVDNPVEEFEIWASVQPLSNADRDLVQAELNLNRYAEGVRIYSDVPLLADDDKKRIRGDTIIVEGESYKVFTLASWQHLNLRHYRHIAMRES